MKKMRVFGYFARAFIFFAAVCSYSPGSASATAGESTAYLAVGNFVWKEFDDGGARLLKESGPLFGLGFIYEREFENHMSLRPEVELFGGRVDYDGQACDPLSGDCVPATSDVNYFGIKLKADAGYRFGSPELYGEPFTGVGISAWLRDIYDGTAADGTRTAGYAEKWFTMNVRLGVRAEKKISMNKELTASAGVKLPLYNQSTAYISDIGYSNDTTVEPGRKASFFAEAGFRVSDFNVTLFYDSLRFSKSDQDVSVYLPTDQTFLFWQPESTMDVYGFRLGYVF